MRILGYVVAAALALATMSVAWSAWHSMADVQVDTAGTLAMVLGAVATVGLAGVLLALIFISNRRGFDERAGRPDVKRRESRD